jgi:SPP1 gp7 family putative phage head morphogenesis protein
MAKKRRTRQRRSPLWLYPRSIEKSFARELRTLIGGRFDQAMRRIIFPKLEQLVRQAEDERAGRRSDAIPDELAELIRRLEITLEDVPEKSRKRARSMGADLSNVNRSEWRKIQEATLGVEVFAGEPWFRDRMQQMTTANAQMATALTAKQIGRVNEIITTGLQTGMRVETLRKRLQDQIGVTKSKAALLARDQVAKFNSQLTQLRQEEIGVTKYIWRTSRDERVRGRPGGLYSNARPRHWQLEGKYCRWDDPTVYSTDKGRTWKKRSNLEVVELHPGIDYQCRCTPEPVLDEILEGDPDPDVDRPEPTPEIPVTPVVTRPKAKRKKRAAPRRRRDLHDLTPDEQDAEIDIRMKRARADLDKAVKQINDSWDEMSDAAREQFRIQDQLAESPDDVALRAQLELVLERRAKARRTYQRAADKTIDDFIAKEFKAFERADIGVGDIARLSSKTRASRSRKWGKQLEKMIDKRATDNVTVRVLVDHLPAENQGRAFADRGAIFLPRVPERRQFMHEVGHVLEYRNDRLRDASRAFLERRTRGETAQPLKKLTGKNYKEWEVAKKDNFRNAYTGKIYPDDTEGGRGATEILSMGIEQFMEDPQGFYDQDPDFFRFVAKALAGTI